ncbi:MAG TPA: CU044_5270 family protein [Pseudonocardiaceae bacterium]|nr:CU044_5270 family protein [Pseudonocardiaceae bacterium]
MRDKDRKTLEALARARPDALDPARLAGGPRRHQDLAELLATRPAIRPASTRRRLLVPLVGVAAAAAVAIGAVAVGLGQNRGAHTTNSAGPNGHLVLESMANSVENQAADGAYWQFETQDQSLFLIPGNPPYVVAQTGQNDWSIGVRPGEQSLLVSGLNQKRGPWSPEDTRRWMLAGSPATVLAHVGAGKDKLAQRQVPIGGAAPRVDHTNSGGKIAAVGPHNVSYADLRQLPSDQDQLAQTLAKYYAQDGGESNTDQPDWMFEQVSGLISLPISSSVRASAYRILANLPGITSLGTVTDPLGRAGVAVALPPRQSGDLGQQQDQLIVDPRTSTILSSQLVLVQPSKLAISAGMTAGTVTYYQATTHIGWTDQQVGIPPTTR